jgi:hypothetical protein
MRPGCLLLGVAGIENRAESSLIGAGRAADKARMLFGRRDGYSGTRTDGLLLRFDDWPQPEFLVTPTIPYRGRAE